MGSRDSWKQSLNMVAAVTRFARRRNDDDPESATAKENRNRVQSPGQRSASPGSLQRSAIGSSDLPADLKSPPARQWSMSSAGSVSSAAELSRRQRRPQALPLKETLKEEQCGCSSAVVGEPTSNLDLNGISSEEYRPDPNSAAGVQERFRDPQRSGTGESTFSSAPSSLTMATSVTSNSTLPDSPRPICFHGWNNNTPCQSGCNRVFESPPFRPEMFTSPLGSPLMPGLNHQPNNIARLPIVNGNNPFERIPSEDEAVDDGDQESGTEDEADSEPPSGENMKDSDTIRPRSGSDTSRGSNGYASTPSSDDDDSDSDSDASSTRDDSETTSDAPQNTVQQDLLEQLMEPVKRVVVERLMSYISQLPDFRGTFPQIAFPGSYSPSKPDDSSLPFHIRDHELPDGSYDRKPIGADLYRGATPSNLLNTCGDAPQDQPCDAGPSGPSTGQGRQTSGAGGKQQTINNHKRKNHGGSSFEGNEEEDDEDDERERRRGSKAPRNMSPAPHNRKIACPYFQRDPANPKADSCFRNGFPSISKMKEHLDRVHNNSIQCPRCYTVFKDAQHLSAHLRVDPADLCEPCQETPVLNGYNQEQGTSLSNRMRGKSVEAKWQNIWMILFPDDHAIPPPWWSPRQTSQLLSFFNRYADFTRERLPDLVRPRLEQLVDGFVHNLGPDIDVIVRSSLEETFADFTTTHAVEVDLEQSPATPVGGDLSGDVSGARAGPASRDVEMTSGGTPVAANEEESPVMVTAPPMFPNAHLPPQFQAQQVNSNFQPVADPIFGNGMDTYQSWIHMPIVSTPDGQGSWAMSGEGSNGNMPYSSESMYYGGQDNGYDGAGGNQG